MTAVPLAPPVTTSDPRLTRFVEFMLVGGMTLFLFPLAWLFRKTVGLNDAFGRDRPLGQRLRYLASGVLAPAVLVTWAIGALVLHSAQTIGWMVQLMYLLVGWHYAKQGFGVLAVLSARRGVRVTPRERAVLLVHCYAGWVFAWANPTTAAGEFEEKGVVYRALAHPRWLELGAGVALAASTIAMIVVLLTTWRRQGRTLPAAPLAGFLITIWSWTIFTSLDPLVRYLIPALHSVQYLYFVWLMKRNEAREAEGPPTFGRPVAVRLGFLAVSAIALAWLLFHGAPGYFDGILVSPSRARDLDDPLGATPFFATFFVVVNLHHYFMDTVIWRRDNPEMRWLRASPP